MRIGTETIIFKTKFYEPRKNLPGRASIAVNDEVRFTIQFAKAYISQFRSIHYGTKKTSIACAREIPINGLGIADFMAVMWNSEYIDDSTIPCKSKEFITSAKPTVRAFELKMTNWRKAMVQASRYKYFANVSVVVLPVEKCISPLKYLDTFKKIRVGLWGFNTKSNRIIPFLTPKSAKPMDPKYQLRAIDLIATASKALPVS